MTLALVLALTLAQPVTVSFDLRPLPEGDYRALDGLALERKVALRLVQEGFAVVGPDVAAQIRIRVTKVPKGVRLEALGGTSPMERTLRTEKVSTPEVHLEISQKVSELARATELPAPAPVVSPPPIVVEVPVPVPGPEQRIVDPALPPEPRLAITALGGLGFRGSALEALFLGAFRLDFRGPGLELELGGGPTSTAAVNAWGLQAALNLGIRFTLHERVHLEPSLGGGVLLHGYSVNDAFLSARSGLVASPAGWAKARLQWSLSDLFALELRVGAAFTTGIEHRGDGEVLWSRGPVRLEALLGARWAFGHFGRADDEEMNPGLSRSGWRLETAPAK